MEDDFEYFDLDEDDLPADDDEYVKGQRGEFVEYRKIRRRTARLTQKQRQYMLNYMVQHPNFAQARCNQTRNKDQMWKSLSTQLNKLGPCKSVLQWKIIWKELKSRVRKKVKSLKGGESSDNKIYLTEQEIKLFNILDGSVPNRVYSNEAAESTEPNCTEDNYNTADMIGDDVEQPSSTQQCTSKVINKQTYRKPVQLKRPVRFLRKAMDGDLSSNDRKINETIAASLMSIADSMKKRVEIEERRTKIEAENNKIMKRLLNVLPKMFEDVVQSELCDVLDCGMSNS